jgi:NADH-quinone oxidoreductase subunit N
VPLYPPISFLAILPEIILVIAGCAVLIVAAAKSERTQAAAPWISLSAIIVAAIGVIWMAPQLLNQVEGTETPGGLLYHALEQGSGLYFGSLAGFVRYNTLILGFLLTLVAWMQPASDERGEFFSMMLFSLVGLMLLGPAEDILMLFLALELISIPTYILVALSRKQMAASEAATKYFYLGALSAAVMAYGISLLYGVAGSTSFADIYVALADRETGAFVQPFGSLEYTLAVVGVVMTLGGLLFKIAAFPMHFYIADVYQGAGNSVAALLGFVPKFGGIVAIIKLISLTGWWESFTSGAYLHEMFWLLWILAAITMTVGNALALRQTNIKRMLGYSGIAHSGYMLVGLMAGPLGGDGFLGDGTAAVLYYIVIYGIANLAAFATLGLLKAHGGKACETLQDVAGLVRRHPGWAMILVLAMFTLMGLPPTPGFWGKLSLFGSALATASEMPAEMATQQSWLIGLVIIAALNSALAAAYYLRVIAAVLLYENDEPATAVDQGMPQAGTMIAAILLVIFCFRPVDLLNRGRQATTRLRNFDGYSSLVHRDRQSTQRQLTQSRSTEIAHPVIFEERAN